MINATPLAPLALPPNLPPSSCLDRKSTRLNSSHGYISYAVFCLKKKKIATLLVQYDRSHHHVTYSASSIISISNDAQQKIIFDEKFDWLSTCSDAAVRYSCIHCQ